MVRNRRVFLPALLITLGLALSGCSDDSAARGRPGGDPQTGAPPAYQAVNQLSDYQPLEPGAYALTPIGPNEGPLAIFDVPDGYVSSGSFFIPEGEGTWRSPESCCLIGVWTISGVYKNPCTTDAKSWPKPGPSVEDLAEALVAQRLTTTTRPVPVTLDGYDGEYLILAGPPDLDISTCTDGTIDYWEADPGTRYDETPGKAGTDHLWILDVDGQRVVLDIGLQPGAAEAQIQELTDIVESVRFEP